MDASSSMASRPAIVTSDCDAVLARNHFPPGVLSASAASKARARVKARET